MADQTEEQRRYNAPVGELAKDEAADIKKTAEKIPADHSEQKTTTSTEGSVERTTSRSGDRG
jgi:hypothetical protein